MKTDIVLTSADRVLIIDTKHTATVMQSYYKETWRSEHLYQLFAYVKNYQGDPRETRKVEGMLLYPTVERSVRTEVSLGGNRFAVRSIDLNQSWPQIHADLLMLIT